jgi:hypothetical protein
MTVPFLSPITRSQALYGVCERLVTCVSAAERHD